MKKFIMLIAVTVLLVSCDYILKKEEKTTTQPEQVVTGTDTDKDEKGCVISAGYRWSLLKNNCIRPVEEGYRLNSMELLEGESTYRSAFVTFNEDRTQAELFLPEVRTSRILKKNKSNVYSDGHWNLLVNKKYSLEKDGTLLYQGAEVQEGQVTGNDSPED